MLANSTILPNERELFSRIAEGDEAAFTHVFHQYNQRLYPFVLKMVKLDHIAEEIVQEVFTNLWVKRQHLAEVESPQSYIFRMATNRTLDQMKKMMRDASLLKELKATMDNVTNNEIEEWFDGKQSAELLQDAVNSLPAQRRLVYRLAKEQGKTHEQISKELNITPNTVHTHLVRAIRSIKEYLKNAPGGTIALMIFLCEMGH